MQPQGHIQVLMNIVYGGMSPQGAFVLIPVLTHAGALDAPRFCVSPGMPAAGASDTAEISNAVIQLEDTLPNVEATADALRKLGHAIQVTKPSMSSGFGRGQIIQRHETEDGLVWAAGSDPRCVAGSDSFLLTQAAPMVQRCRRSKVACLTRRAA